MNHKKTIRIFRSLALSLLIIALTCGTLYASDLLTGKPLLKQFSKGIPEAPLVMRAFTVPTGSSGDFPGMPNLSAKAQRDQLDRMLTFAETYGFNTIFYEAVAEGDAFYRSQHLPVSAAWMGEQGGFTFFDPLDYLTNAAKEKNIRVYALVDPFTISTQSSSPKSPAVKNADWVTKSGILNPDEQGVHKLLKEVAGELGKNYDIAGVVLHQIDSPPQLEINSYPASLAELTSQMQRTLREGQQLGVALDASAALPGNVFSSFLSRAFDQKSIDFVVTTGSPDPIAQTDLLVEQLTAWQSTLPEGISYYPQHSVNDQTAATHTVDNAGYFEKQYGAGGVIVSSYADLDTETPVAAVSLAASFQQQPPAELPELAFSQLFSITRPAEELYLSSDWASYYIMGTSQPGTPVIYDGEEISTSTGGLWGLLVSLEYGVNEFSFTQGGTTQSITIHRADPAATSAISDITKSSPYPSASEMVLPGESITLSCVAPAGGTVTASLGSLSVELKPTAKAQDGTAVTYQAKLDISSLAVAGRVTGLGEVNYQLNYQGLNSFRKSAGMVYVAGKGATPVAKMNAFAAMVNQNPENDGVYRSILRKDCVDVITGSVGNYYSLSMGGYIGKSAVDIPEGDTSATATVSKIALMSTPKGEKLVISNDLRPAYAGALDEKTLVVTIYNTVGWEKMNPRALKGELFNSLSAEIDENTNSVTLTFTLSETADLIGWDVAFEGDDMQIYLRKRPEVGSNPTRPLENVTVVLDPGHGGDDPGALGVPGKQGAVESTLNLADSYSIRSRLEVLGATVHMVHENATVSLNERLEFAQKMDADVFISSHHNSVAETSDGGKPTGIEVYYWNDSSAAFAEQIGNNLAAQNERNMRGAEQSFYRVTMMTACPAVLVESGFISNPLEYEQIATPYAMMRYGNAVADAVLQYFRPDLFPEA